MPRVSGKQTFHNAENLFAEVGERRVVYEVAQTEWDHESEEWVARDAKGNGEDIVGEGRGGAIEDKDKR